MKDMELVDGRSGGEGGAAAGRCGQGNKSQTASSNLAELRSGTRAVNDHENVTGAFDANKFNSHGSSTLRALARPYRSFADTTPCFYDTI